MIVVGPDMEIAAIRRRYDRIRISSFTKRYVTPRTSHRNVNAGP